MVAAQVAGQRHMAAAAHKSKRGHHDGASIMAPAAEVSGTAGISAKLTSTEAPAARQPKLGHGGQTRGTPEARRGRAAPAERQPKRGPVEHARSLAARRSRQAQRDQRHTPAP